jgi:RNA polymerase sigma-70 factor, ECF subfamily
VTDTAPAHRAAERAARQSYGKLVACLAARTGDVAAAEDALCDAFAAALASWPTRGVPQAPDAWLLAAARRRMIDMARRRRSREAAADQLLLSVEHAAEEMNPADVPDWRLRLMLARAHPAIDAAMRAVLGRTSSRRGAATAERGEGYFRLTNVKSIEAPKNLRAAPRL